MGECTPGISYPRKYLGLWGGVLKFAIFTAHEGKWQNTKHAPVVAFNGGSEAARRCVLLAIAPAITEHAAGLLSRSQLPTFCTDCNHQTPTHTTLAHLHARHPTRHSHPTTTHMDGHGGAFCSPSPRYRWTCRWPAVVPVCRDSVPIATTKHPRTPHSRTHMRAIQHATHTQPRRTWTTTAACSARHRPRYR